MKKKSVFLTVGGVALTAVSVITLQPLIKKYADKLYKTSLRNEAIDFDNLGPEIVKADSKENEKETECE